MMDIPESLASMRMSLHSLRSALDSFSFEIGKSIITDERDRSAYIVKIFKSQHLHQISEVDSYLGSLETEMQNNKLLAMFRQAENEMERQKESLKRLALNNLDLSRENEEMKREIENLNQSLHTIQNSQKKKNDFIGQLKQRVKNCEDALQEEKIRSKNKVVYQNKESKFMEETLQSKDNEINNLKKDKKELNTTMMKINTEMSELRKMLKDSEKQVEKNQLDIKDSSKLDTEDLVESRNQTDESKSEMQKKEIERKMENKVINTLNTEIANAHHQIQKLKEEIKARNCHLKTDYVLIKSLKNEIIHLNHKIRSETRQREKINDEKEKSKSLKEQICSEVKTEPQKSAFQPVNITEESTSQELVKTTHKVKEDSADLKEVRDVPEKIPDISDKTGNSLKMYKLKIDRLERELAKSRRQIRNLNVMKSVADDKIKLLNQFIEDFRIRELCGQITTTI